MFFSGLLLWIVSVAVTELTRNSNLIPTVVLLGSFLVPATAVVYYLDHGHSPTLSAQRVFFAFVYGGVTGILAAALLEAWLLQDGPFLYLGVGLIEEFAKLLALLLVGWGLRRFTTRDGIILGAAVGFGFAAFESSGYAFSALFTPHGLSLFSLVYTEVLRGVLAPVGHGLWTGILGGVLFEAAARRGHLALTGRLLVTFLVVSFLHGLWDSMRGIAIVLTLLTAHAAVTSVFVIWEFGGMAIVSGIGLWMLRSAWRRARLQVSPA